MTLREASEQPIPGFAGNRPLARGGPAARNWFRSAIFPLGHRMFPGDIVLLGVEVMPKNLDHFVVGDLGEQPNQPLRGVKGVPVRGDAQERCPDVLNEVERVEPAAEAGMEAAADSSTDVGAELAAEFSGGGAIPTPGPGQELTEVLGIGHRFPTCLPQEAKK